MEEDSRKLDRTWLCSVLFLDIVNYSSQPVETQVRWKAFFNSCLSEALLSVLADDRIVLDTGDGAVVCFLGDPETALLASLSILNQFRSHQDVDKPAAFVRVGINLGPIRLIRDINNNLNAVGDGINVGQRVMSFASGNQLLISRSYYEVISTLSANYKSLFRFDGVRHDKHIREHTVYALVQEHEPGSESSVIESPTSQFNETVRSGSSSFRPEDLAAIEKGLSDFVGPIAPHLVRKATTQVDGLPALCEVLAGSAVASADRPAFLKRCRDIIGAPSEPGKTALERNGSGPAAKIWDSGFLDTLRRQLAEYVGPIAGVLVNRAAVTAATQEEIYTQLSNQIKSERERQKFLSLRK